MNQRQTHELKTWPEYYHAVDQGKKPFELRKSDRDFLVDDLLHLREWQPDGGTEGGGYYTGRSLVRVVTYVLHGPTFGLAEGYCILGLGTP